jgi:hypothetical protein
VSEAESRTSILKERLRAHWQFARFAYEMLIAPWPVFVLLLAVIGIIGGLTLLVEIRAMTGLVNTLTTRAPTIRKRTLRLEALEAQS